MPKLRLDLPGRMGKLRKKNGGADDDDGGKDGDRGASSRTDSMQTENAEHDDPHNLHERFVMNQKMMYPRALTEIRRGMKLSCWLWFVLPSAPYVVDGVERGSKTNRYFALRGDDAVRAYLECRRAGGVGGSDDFDDEGGGGSSTISLRDNYVEILRAIRSQLERGNDLPNLLGPVDASKALSSFRLFRRIAEDVTFDAELASVCDSVLDLAGEGAARKQIRQHRR